MAGGAAGPEDDELLDAYSRAVVRAAELVGEDPATDLAGLRTGVRPLPHVELADSARLREGRTLRPAGTPAEAPGGAR